MKIRAFAALFIVFIIVFFIQQNEELKSVFRLTEQPDVLVKGNHGMALTVDLSFGREDVEEWIGNLEKPYPLLFLDAAWIERSPLIVKKIKEKKIPVGLLGQDSKNYEDSPKHLEKEIKAFESAFGYVPLWYRTHDHKFTDTLKAQVWEYQVNMVGASIAWTSGPTPKVKKGDIVSASLHKDERVDLKALTSFQKSHPFVSLEETIFGYKTESKTFP